ncbi:MAG: glucose-1-phosphate thymidylyltransferase [Bdellovibrionota bacterium]
MSRKLTTRDLMDVEALLHKDKIPDSPFELLGDSLSNWIKRLLASLNCTDEPVIKGQVEEGAFIRGQVYIAEGAKVESTAMVIGPSYIGPGSEVRHGAYIRGSVYVGADCVVGHATEAKGSCFFDGAKAGHFAYVGDSLLGRNVNLGAGTKLANLKLTKDQVAYKDPFDGMIVKSGLRKFGALIADDASTGCNAVLSPGAVLMPGTSVFPCVHFHGTLEKGIARKSR